MVSKRRSCKMSWIRFSSVPGSTVNPSGLRRFFTLRSFVFGNNGGLIRQAIVEIINLLLCQIVSFVLTQRTMAFYPKVYVFQSLTIVRVITQHISSARHSRVSSTKTVLLPCAGSTGHWPCLRIQSTISVSGKGFFCTTLRMKVLITSPPLQCQGPSASIVSLV